MKKCIKCNEEKNLEEFHKTKSKKDGKCPYCKKCESERRKNSYNPEKYKNAEYREKNREKSRNWYWKNLDKARENCKKYAKKNRHKLNEANKRWRNRHPDQARANHYLLNHVTRGKVKRPTSCERCNFQGKIEAHHEDYSKPLLVVWLCKRCHVKETFRK